MCRPISYWTVPYLIFQIQLGAWPSSIERFLPEPLGPDLQPTATGCTAGWPGWPVTELTVEGARDVANLHHVAWNWTLADGRKRPHSDLLSSCSNDHNNNGRQTCLRLTLRQTLDLLTLTPRCICVSPYGITWHRKTAKDFSHCILFSFRWLSLSCLLHCNMHEHSKKT